MGTHADKEREIKNQSSLSNPARQQGGGESSIRLVDNRPQTLLQQQQWDSADDTQAPIQRYVYLNRRATPLSRSSRNEARRIAEGIAPQRVDQIMEIYGRWINDLESTNRRFDSLEAAIRAINNQLPPLETRESRTHRPENGSSGSAPEEQRPAFGVNPAGQPAERQTPEQTGGERSLEPQSSTRGPQPDREHDRESVHEQDEALRLNEETHTRVGFEIEVGGYYTFPLAAMDTLEQLVNRTLYEGVVNGTVVLEMLLDDIHPRERTVTAQVEFRTTPQNLTNIDQDLGSAVRRSIGAFQSAWLSDAAPHNFSVEGGPNGRRGTWRPTDLLRRHAQVLRDGTGSNPRFRVSGPLAQHATTSIELEAFGQLNEQQQGSLYPQGVGASDKQELLDILARRVSGGSGRLIDATTRGRNDERTTVKSPLESILAADPELRVPDNLPPSGQVTIARDETFDLEEPQQAIEEIRRRGTFPEIQGQHDRGYRAVAEKLQAPLRDRVSGQLRVLVEHRRGGLVAAVNAALNGNGRALREIMRAATTMDNARVERAPSTPERRGESSGNRDNSSPGLEVESSDIHEEQEQIVYPAIAPPLVHNLNAANMAVHYFNAIQWANAQGTYSDEFHFVRDHPDQARQRLNNAGMAPGAAQAFTDGFTHEIGQRPGTEAGYVGAETQEAILNQLGSGEQLLAIIRYLTHE